MQEKASTRQLKAAFRSHLAETKQHEKRAAEALKQLGEKASGKTCEVDAATGSVAADSLAPKRVGELMFPIAQAHIVVLVTDHAIRMAQRMLWEGLRLVPSTGGRA